MGSGDLRMDPLVNSGRAAPEGLLLHQPFLVMAAKSVFRIEKRDTAASTS
jgi:hypothetical protein